MIIRLLLHIIDPSVRYVELYVPIEVFLLIVTYSHLLRTGKERRSSYVTAEDISSGSVTVQAEEDRTSDDGDSSDEVDASDMMALLRRSKDSEAPTVGHYLHIMHNQVYSRYTTC
jgi:hypothetical protein